MLGHQKTFQRAASCLAAISHHTQILNGPARIYQAVLQNCFERVPLEYSHTLHAMEWQPMTPELRERLVTLLCKVSAQVMGTTNSAVCPSFREHPVMLLPSAGNVSSS